MSSFEELKEVVRRHPHVFGNTKVDNSEEVLVRREEDVTYSGVSGWISGETLTAGENEIHWVR